MDGFSNPIVWVYGVYMLVVNGLTATLYYRDKRAAQQRKWRIPEKRLFLANFLGGVIGGWFGLLVLHHKTRHASFWTVQLVATLIHLGLAVGLFQLLGLF